MKIVGAAALAAALAGASLCAYAADGAPIGAWRATNDCFLAAFLLTDDGRAQALYLTGERDQNAVWTWDGNTLRITSRMFDLDKFSGRIENGHIEAAYTWHDLDKDELHDQACSFERFTDLGI